MKNNGQSLIRGPGLAGIIALGVDNVIGGGINYISVQIQSKVIGIANLLPLVMIVGGCIGKESWDFYPPFHSGLPNAQRRELSPISIQAFSAPSLIKSAWFPLENG